MGGEYVMNRSAVNKYGAGFMDNLNNGSISKFASGGRVGSAPEIGTELMSTGEGSNNELVIALKNLTKQLTKEDEKTNTRGG